MADAHEDKKKNNIVALRGYRLKGRGVAVGEVVAKSDFAKKGDWQNICHMEPAKAEETDAPVGKPKAAKADGKAAGKAAGMPGA